MVSRSAALAGRATKMVVGANHYVLKNQMEGRTNILITLLLSLFVVLLLLLSGTDGKNLLVTWSQALTLLQTIVDCNRI